MIKFEDIEEPDEPQAFDEFRVLLLRLLRYPCPSPGTSALSKKTVRSSNASFRPSYWECSSTWGTS
jgi:hypothetical protein